MKLDYNKATKKEIQASWEFYEARNEKLEDIYAAERASWDEDRNNVVQLFTTSDMMRIVNEVQTANLSFRSRVMERITSTLRLYSKENNKLKIALGDRREFYAIGNGVKYSDTQTKDLLNRDLSSVQRNVEIIETHVEYLREIIKWSDQIGYAIKNKIEVHRLKYNE